MANTVDIEQMPNSIATDLDIYWQVKFVCLNTKDKYCTSIAHFHKKGPKADDDLVSYISFNIINP